MDVVGYAYIKKDATTGVSAAPIKNFLGERCRVMEFAEDGGVLVLDSQATGLAMFDKCDVQTSFKCSFSGEIVCPPSDSPIESMLYAGRCMSRKGGYNNLVREMVIEASLMKGTFSDSFLWQMQ